ncbi:P-loop containing nucleoside triphosphate hydrolase protein [Phellopilus nigrolimitatus]|nr:P-loop containing nucleoside triphosphate hydrolase protein [Phellopilus nigrolimitatus]
MAPSTPTPSTPTRRLTRSQTSTTVLGKRSASRSSSVVSNKSSMSMITPEATPNPKRFRASLEEVDSRANKENIPPLRDLLFESPSASRLSRRSSFSSDVSTTSTRPRTNLSRRSTHNAIPQTPSTALNNLTLATPPATPPFTIPLYLRVRGLLRATSNSNHIMSMAGRATERSIVESFLHSFDEDASVSESVLYVSGSPGTGKTALINSIIASAKVSDDVKVLFLNCMAFSGMDALWQRLAEELSGASTKARPGRRAIGKKLHGKDEVSAILDKQRDLKCVLVLDELDNLSEGSSNTLQPLFALAASYPSTIRIMGIANTHTLTSTSSVIPLSLDSMDVSVSNSPSKMGAKKSLKIKTVHFAPYTPSELLAILDKRFESLPRDELKKLLPQSTLMLLTKKVSALTGDVRVLFEVLRGAIDLAIPDSETSTPTSSPPPRDISKTSVSPAHILSALKSFMPTSATSKSKSSIATSFAAAITTSNSETAAKVRDLGLQARLVLLALVLASKRVTATLSLSGSSAPSPAKTPSSPTKRSPMKRTNSATAVGLIARDANPSSADCSQLHAYYTSLLTVTDTFTPVSRSDFTDLLGVLETTGLVALSTPAARAPKRTASFNGKTKGAPGAQVVGLQGHVREAEIARGLGIGAEASGDGDVMEDDVRAIWTREMGRIRREAKAKDALASLEGMDGFDDAMED